MAIDIGQAKSPLPVSPRGRFATTRDADKDRRWAFVLPPAVLTQWQASIPNVFFYVVSRQGLKSSPGMPLLTYCVQHLPARPLMMLAPRTKRTTQAAIMTWRWPVPCELRSLANWRKHHSLSRIRGSRPRRGTRASSARSSASSFVIMSTRSGNSNRSSTSHFPARSRRTSCMQKRVSARPNGQTAVMSCRKFAVPS